MKKLFTFLSFIVCCGFAKAQYVNIPDSNFRNFLIGKYPNCFNGAKLMDTSCSLIVNEFNLNCSNKNITNTYGIEFFKGLFSFTCDSNKIDSLIKLPTNLQSLTFKKTSIKKMLSFPPNLKYLYCNNNDLIELSNFPTDIRIINCSNNPNLKCLAFLPSSLNSLTVKNTSIKCIPNKIPQVTNLSLPICNPTNKSQQLQLFPKHPILCSHKQHSQKQTQAHPFKFQLFLYQPPRHSILKCR